MRLFERRRTRGRVAFSSFRIILAVFFHWSRRELRTGWEGGREMRREGGREGGGERERGKEREGERKREGGGGGGRKEGKLTGR